MKHKIGFMGLGKLGLPVATSMAMRGADIMGFDVNPDRMSYNKQPYQEAGPKGSGDFNDWLAAYDVVVRATSVEERIEDLKRMGRGCLRFGDVAAVCDHADIIFVAVQTPHDPRYEGITVIKDDPVDFDYSHLKHAVELLIPHVKKPTAIVVISTVLPGTMAREIKPLMAQNPNLRLVYNPAFIAMGTTMEDFLNPEFVLLGVDDKEACQKVEQFYSDILPGAPQRTMSVPSAELTKVAYNTAISQKIALANTVMEICHKTQGANCDDVTRAMKAAYRRLTGPAYMDGGMGDGGGCHPRDNIALGWLAKKLNLSYDPFTSAMYGRERQSQWIADIVMNEWHSLRSSMPVDPGLLIAGFAYKPGTNITTGSPALLLQHQLETLGYKVSMFDPHVLSKGVSWMDIFAPMMLPSVIVIGCRHQSLVEFDWAAPHLPAGTVIVDPFRIVPRDLANVKVVHVGIGEAYGTRIDETASSSTSDISHGKEGC